MRVPKKHIFAVLTVVALVATYFLFSIVLTPKLEFRDRTFFRDLVLETASSQLDPFRDLHSPAAGNRDSRIQIVAFLDYRCPYCRKLTAILSELQAENVRIVYKEWPILGDSSILPARAGLAADEQGQYLAFHTRLMSSRLMPTAAYVEEIAAGFGVNRSQLRTDMNSPGVTLTSAK